jgi:hypothetical protein
MRLRYFGDGKKDVEMTVEGFLRLRGLWEIV